MNSTLRCIIIDDDLNACNSLANQIAHSGCGFSVIGQTTNPFEGKKLIEKLSPEIVFLDIQMPGMDGFQLLEVLPVNDFCVVFTTSHTKYAIQAFKKHALDYLIKPIQSEDLLDLATRLNNLIHSYQNRNSTFLSDYHHSLKRFSNSGNEENSGDSITVAHAKGLKIIRFSRLICLKAKGPYCEFCLEGESFVASKSMKYFEELLPPHTFIKVHKSSIINLNFLEGYIVEDAGYALMTNGDRLEISRRRRDGFLKVIKELGKGGRLQSN